MQHPKFYLCYLLVFLFLVSCIKDEESSPGGFVRINLIDQEVYFHRTNFSLNQDGTYDFFLVQYDEGELKSGDLKLFNIPIMEGTHAFGTQLNDSTTIYAEYWNSTFDVPGNKFLSEDVDGDAWCNILEYDEANQLIKGEIHLNNMELDTGPNSTRTGSISLTDGYFELSLIAH